VKKRALPSAHGRERAAGDSVIPPAERAPLEQRVVAIAQATFGDAAAQFAVELVRAMLAEGLPVAALVTSDDPNADAQAVLSALHDAGARDTAWVRLPRDAPKPALERALARFAADDWLVVLGNTLPLFFRPLLCALVSAPRATHVPDAQRLARYAELQVTTPSPKLAAELAALIRAKALVRVPANG
jgi:hypothetical protein